jgi:predicted nucleotidyltransferase
LDYESLLLKAIEQVHIPDDAIVALEGSIAEGFGNRTSDIDFVVIDRSGREFQTIPTVLFMEGRRVEVRFRSVHTMLKQLDLVAEASRAGRRRLARLDEEVLDRCQRFLRSMPLRHAEALSELKEQMPFRELCAVVSAWFAEQTWDTLGVMAAMKALSQDAEAASWAKSAVTVGLKSWLADRGETYLAKKWISQQLDRAGAADGLKKMFLALESPEKAGLSNAKYVEAAIQFMTELGFSLSEVDHEKVILKKAPNVTTWQIGTRVHLISQRADVYALSAEAGYVWRHLAFERPILQAVRTTHEEVEGASRILAEFHQYGLVKFAQLGRGEMRLRKAFVPPPAGSGAVLVGIEGIAFAAGETKAVKLAPIPARRFAAAGMELVYVNMIVENAREDALGALLDEQWQVFERSVRRMLRFACRAALSAAGVNPLPPVEEVLLRAVELTVLPPRIKSRILELDCSIDVHNRTAAEDLLNRIDAVNLEIRDATSSALFPSSFLSSADWRETLEIGYDWARLGGYLNADFPLDQARDLIASGGHKQGEGAASGSAGDHQRAAAQA